ncbi:hypothetical protein [Corynebacterium sp. Marseille-P4321]|uniref:hypothetical protein n=1 Tax=Corynebacterium sp. Marseille-P4321 TaxID=2736603 RepID=UPI000893D7B3|nr:hypothetical protein [Corynebacterium sp. Marseille-P4321]OEX94421.1 hypothetical protein A0K93_09310 [Corynebacterium sp. BCW_4722]
MHRNTRATAAAASLMLAAAGLTACSASAGGEIPEGYYRLKDDSESRTELKIYGGDNHYCTVEVKETPNSPLEREKCFFDPETGSFTTEKYFEEGTYSINGETITVKFPELGKLVFEYVEDK